MSVGGGFLSGGMEPLGSPCSFFTYGTPEAWLILPEAQRRYYEALISERARAVEPFLFKETTTQEEPINLAKDSGEENRPSGFLYFLETCRLNFPALGGSVLKFHDDAWKAWSLLPSETREYYQATAELELNVFKYKSRDPNYRTLPGTNTQDLFLKDLKFHPENFTSLISNRQQPFQPPICRRNSPLKRKPKRAQLLPDKCDVSDISGDKASHNLENEDFGGMEMLEHKNSFKSEETDAPIVKGKRRRRGVGSKKWKDPNAPKKPMTSYLFFVSENRHVVREQNPNFSFSDVSKVLGIQWKGMSEKDKNYFHLRAIQDKHRYDMEMKAYQQKNDSLSDFGDRSPTLQHP